MKCLQRYDWVKLPRNALPTGKGIMGAWMELASRAAFRKGVASYCGYENAVEPGMWAGGVVGLKSILGVRSRVKALKTLDKLARLGYLTYELDKETKKLIYQITDWVVKCSGKECMDGAVYTTDGYGFLCLPRNITERLAQQHYTFEETDAWFDLWCHTVWEDPDNGFSFLAPTVQYGKYGATLTLETLGQRWGWEKTKVWRFLKKHGDGFSLYRLPGNYGCLIFNKSYPTGTEVSLPAQNEVVRIFEEIRFLGANRHKGNMGQSRFGKLVLLSRVMLPAAGAIAQLTSLAPVVPSGHLWFASGVNCTLGDLRGSYANNAEWVIFCQKGRRPFQRTSLVLNKHQGEHYGSWEPVSRYKQRHNACWFGQEYPKSTYNSSWLCKQGLCHPTVKNVEFLSWLIQISSQPGELVFDGFMGLGSTALAAILTGRDYLGAEIDRGYYETAQRRLNTAMNLDTDMTKTFKRFLAIIMTVMLVFSVVPTTVFAAEVPPAPESTVSSEVFQEPEPTPLPEITPAPTSAPEAAETVEPSPIPEPSAEPEDTELTPGTELNMDRIWPAIRRAQARAAANIGTSGTLYVGDYCFTSAVGVPPTLGEHIGLMPVETMRFGSNNVAAYCLEHSKESGDGMGYTWMDLTTNNQDTVGTILALGFQWNSPSNWAVPSDDSDKWIVTQVLIWEAIANHAFKQGNGLYGVESGVDADMQMISTHAHNPSKFMEYYRDLKKRLNDYLKVPSFASKEASKAETITLRWDGSKYSATVTDTNSVLRNFTFDNKIPGVKITTSGNSMTLSATEPVLSPKTSPAIHNNMAAAGGKGAVAVWRTADRDFQDFGTYNVSGGDPVSCYIKVKTDAVGSAGLKKTSEDGNPVEVDGRKVAPNEVATTITTNAQGVATTGPDVLPYGDYIVREKSTNNSMFKTFIEEIPVTISENSKMYTFTAENDVVRGGIAVEKRDSQTGERPQGNADFSGITFTG